jgi:hypothetical protein
MAIDHIFKSDGVDKDYYMMIVDRDGMMHFANSYLISNLGLTHYEIPKYNFFHLLDSDQLRDFIGTLSEVQANQMPAEIELSARNVNFLPTYRENKNSFVLAMILSARKRQ